MKKLISGILAALLLMAICCAEGALPKLTDIYGKELPRLGNAIGRDADSEETDADGTLTQTYLNVTEEDYSAIDAYLTRKGCALADYTVEGSTLSAQMTLDGYTFSMTYDAAGGVVTVGYPKGTYAEAYSLYPAGSYITFGSYAGEPIEWLILEANGDERLMISVKGLEAKLYNTKDTAVTWETCTLRKWLNEEFLNVAFTADEQAMLETVMVTADENPDYSTDPGNDTQDKVWLLSITEAERYFSSDEERICYPTQHAKDNGAFVNSNTGGCWWWLRSPGYDSRIAAYVNPDGYGRPRGNYVGSGSGCVRPVVSLRLS